MQDQRKLFLVKLLHTIIWAFFVTLIAYIVWAGITDDIGMSVWLAIGAVILEGAVLVVNHGKCPLTNIGARYTEDRSDSFDIFLHNWLARHNKMIFTSIFMLGVLLVLYRTFA